MYKEESFKKYFQQLFTSFCRGKNFVCFFQKKCPYLFCTHVTTVSWYIRVLKVIISSSSGAPATSKHRQLSHHPLQSSSNSQLQARKQAKQGERKVLIFAMIIRIINLLIESNGHKPRHKAEKALYTKWSWKFNWSFASCKLISLGVLYILYEKLFREVCNLKASPCKEK